MSYLCKNDIIKKMLEVMKLMSAEKYLETLKKTRLIDDTFSEGATSNGRIENTRGKAKRICGVNLRSTLVLHF